MIMEENGPVPAGAMMELMDDGSDTGPLLPLPAAARDTLEWQATIEKVILTVVQIRFCQTCTFDTDPAGASEATGFVVDAERGYILTNRHVVGAGPFWGYCIFDNHEEVRLIFKLIAFTSGTLLFSARSSTDVRTDTTMSPASATSTLSIATPSTTLVSCGSTPRRSSTCLSRPWTCSPSTLASGSRSGS